MNTSGSDYSTVLAVFTGSCGSLAQVACSYDPEYGAESHLALGVSAGVPLLILVGGTSGVGGALSFHFWFETGLPNDNCAGAEPIILDLSGSFIDQLDTSDATYEVGEPTLCCLGEAQSASVWYSYTPLQAGSIQVHTFGSDYDTVLGVFTGTCGSLIERACNDDAGGTSQSEIELGVAAGEPLIVLAGAFYGAGGDLHFSFSFSAAPANDDCANATLIQAVPFQDSVDTRYATREPAGEPFLTCGYADRTHSIWYTYTPPGNGALTIQTCGSDYRTVIALFTGGCGSLQEVACNAQGLCFPGTSIAMLAGAGWNTFAHRNRG